MLYLGLFMTVVGSFILGRLVGLKKGFDRGIVRGLLVCDELQRVADRRAIPVDRDEATRQLPRGRVERQI